MTVAHASLLCLFVLAFSSARPARAEGPGRRVPAPASAARELVCTMGGVKSAESGADVILAAVRSNPQLAPYEDVFRTWYWDAIASADLEGKMIALYAETFTEQEIRDLTAFYRTPLGRKALEKMPELTRRGAEIATVAAEESQTELERRLEERHDEIEKLEKQKKSDEENASRVGAHPTGR